ncbi:DUF4224 domain-containing protein [Serratia marcescens]|uniref:DUF4224 domain-containing protein n=1 Tax=Serratia TaxID=613 RepID=UPI000C13264E|nr:MULTISPECIES: DUF4224 domain-containing protein [Serratia]MBF4189242.1 DUF4224 domain-containing protein [Serratia ureilytica]MBF8442863.1 DUF4224 domain-containing protein [Serratia ureilytica]MBF8447704.1 DUF4224 domain-containing protein [Serratia ureilytica]NDY44750.1 DUF4224 domain-containing protein [Serratia marcescens]NDY49493.1 DUF4224 domain-containing protein [Serratia marcescens]
MSTNNELLTDEELIEMTGYKYPSKQCEALARAGISFIKRRDGRPRVTWAHVNAALSGYLTPTVTEENTPNFDAM